MAKTAEYYIRRVAEERRKRVAYFTVTKFEGDDLPKATYTVTWNHASDTMQCDCPNRRRGAHIDDKHGQMIRQWLADGEALAPIVVTPH